MDARPMGLLSLHGVDKRGQEPERQPQTAQKHAGEYVCDVVGSLLRYGSLVLCAASASVARHGFVFDGLV